MSTPVILSSIGCKNDVLCDFPAPQSRRRGTSHSASGHTLACACTARPLPHTHEQSLLRGSKSARRICLAQPPETSQIIPESSTSGKASSAKTSRQQVFASCSIVSAAFAAAAAAIRLAAPVTSPYLFKTDQSAVQTLLHSKCLLLGYETFSSYRICFHSEYVGISEQCLPVCSWPWLQGHARPGTVGNSRHCHRSTLNPAYKCAVI